MKQQQNHRRALKLAAVSVLLATSHLAAADFWWRGDMSNSWSSTQTFIGQIVGTNFSTSSSGAIDAAALPGAGDLVRFATVNAENLNMTVGSNFTIAGLRTSLSLSGGVVMGGNTLNFAGDSAEIVTISPETLTLNNIVTTGTASLDIDTVISSSVVNLNSIFGNASGGAVRGLTKDGSGTLALGGDNTYTGGTTVNAGTLRVGSGGTLGPGSLTLNTTGSVDSLVIFNNANQSMTSLQTGSLGTGEARVTLNGTALTVNQSAANRTFGGVIAGTGSLIKSGTGTLSFTGDHTYGGGTTVSGGALRITSTGSLPSGALTLRTTGSGDTTVFFNNPSQSLSSLQTASGGTGDIAMVLSFTALTVNQSSNTTYVGDITGTGSLIKSGAGVLTFTGDVTPIGGTTVTGGTLRIGNGLTTGSITGNVTNNASLIFFRSNDHFFGGNISGSGTLTKLAAGELTLTGNNTHVGGTTVSLGTLRIGNGGTTGSISGNIVNNAALIFNRSNNSTFAGAISGSGTLTKSGAGTLTFTGDHTYGGETLVEGGTLRISASGSLPTGALKLTTDASGDSTVIFDNPVQSIASLQSNSIGTGDSAIVLNGTALTVNQSSSSTHGGDITGTGSLIKLGSALLALSGDTSHTGGTTITAGTLRIGSFLSTGTISGNIINNASLVFARSTASTFAGNISGGGTLVVNGFLTVTGSNTHTGGTRITGGELRVGSGGTTGLISGNIVIDDTLIFNRSDNLSFGGNISGFGGNNSGIGSLIQAGTGTLTLTGALTYGGNTSVTGGGKLVLNSALNTGTGDVVLSTNGKVDFGVARTVDPVVVGRIDNLTVPSGGIARITRSTRAGALSQGVLIVNTLSITGGGFLDLANNDLIVRQQSLASVRSLVGAWYNSVGGLPGTLGLGSTEAFYTVAGAFTTLAVYDNSIAGQTLASFDGVAVLPTDVLVKYTYLGDTNLDGVVNATDLSRVLLGLNGQGSGWNFGDVNYDGVVNFVDLGRTLAAMRGQGSPLGGSELGGGGVIPEPSAIGVIAGVAMLAGRRRR